MSGTDGSKNKNLVNITWKQFQAWQRWDEYPERNYNPPMTIDMTFWYKTKLYYLGYIDHEYAILTEDWKPLAKDSNFLRLLHKPIKQWHDKSFYELINQLLFYTPINFPLITTAGRRACHPVYTRLPGAGLFCRRP